MTLGCWAAATTIAISRLAATTALAAVTSKG